MSLQKNNLDPLNRKNSVFAIYTTLNTDLPIVLNNFSALPSLEDSLDWKSARSVQIFLQVTVHSVWNMIHQLPVGTKEL